MGIHLDWDVEAQDGERHVGEDPRVLAERQRQKRRLLRTAIIGGAVLAILSVAALVRGVQVGNTRRDMLAATVESEALALRIGDWIAFMLRQGDNDLWRTAQKESFEAYQTLNSRIELPGEILQMEVEGDHASAVLAAIIDNQEHRFTWRYAYTDKGWRHVASEGVPWEPRTLVGNYGITYSYYALDEPLAQSLNVMLGEWWTLVQPLSGGESPDLRVNLEPQLSTAVRWSTDEALIVPSVGLDGQSVREPNETLRSALSHILAIHWGNQALPAEITRTDPWIEGEMQAAIRHLIDPLWSPADVLGPLVDLYGVNFLKTFLDELSAGDAATIALRDAMQLSYAAQSDRVSFASHMQAFLRSEVGCRRVEAYVCPATGIYTAEYQSSFEVSSSAYLWDLEFADADSIRVTGSRQVGDLVWIEVQIDYASDIDDVMNALPSEATIRFFSFRQYDGAWLHSYPRDSDQGAANALNGPYVTLIYFEQDAPFVEGLHPYLEQVYAKVAADFGLAARPTMTATIGAPLTMLYAPRPDGLAIYIPSAYISCCFGGLSPQVQIQHDAAARLVEQVIAYQSNAGYWNDVPGPVETALVEWEMARLGFPPFQPDESYSFRANHFPTSLAASWSTAPFGAHEDPEAYYVRLLIARTLVATVEEQYGEQSVAVLALNLNVAYDLDAWLDASLGIHAADIEPAWAARFAAERDALLRGSP